MSMEEQQDPAPAASVSSTGPLPDDKAALGDQEPLQVPREVINQMLDMPVSEWILWCFSFLGGQAARYLGLTPEGAESTPKDLVQAKLAIDGMGGLAQATELYLAYEDVKNMREVLTQLRLLYVQKNRGTDQEEQPDP